MTTPARLVEPSAKHPPAPCPALHQSTQAQPSQQHSLEESNNECNKLAVAFMTLSWWDFGHPLSHAYKHSYNTHCLDRLAIDRLAGQGLHRSSHLPTSHSTWGHRPRRCSQEKESSNNSHKTRAFIQQQTLAKPCRQDTCIQVLPPCKLETENPFAGDTSTGFIIFPILHYKHHAHHACSSYSL